MGWQVRLVAGRKPARLHLASQRSSRPLPETGERSRYGNAADRIARRKSRARLVAGRPLSSVSKFEPADIGRYLGPPALRGPETGADRPHAFTGMLRPLCSRWTRDRLSVVGDGSQRSLPSGGYGDGREAKNLAGGRHSRALAGRREGTLL